MATTPCPPTLVSVLEKVATSLLPTSATLVKLSSWKKGPQADKHAIEVNFDFLKIVLPATGFKISDTPSLHHAVLEVNADGKLTGDRSRLDAKTWCYDQAQRIHHLISYTIRLCRRSQGTNSLALGTLKTMYRECRGAPSMRAEGHDVIDLTDDVGVCGLADTDPAPLAASPASSAPAAAAWACHSWA